MRAAFRTLASVALFAFAAFTASGAALAQSRPDVGVKVQTTSFLCDHALTSSGHGTCTQSILVVVSGLPVGPASGTARCTVTWRTWEAGNFQPALRSLEESVHLQVQGNQGWGVLTLSRVLGADRAVSAVQMESTACEGAWVPGPSLELPQRALFSLTGNVSAGGG